jgi:hypothetical protein
VDDRGYFNRQTIPDTECAGQYELLNRAYLTGAVHGRKGKPESVEWVEIGVLPSNKGFATFET